MHRQNAKGLRERVVIANLDFEYRILVGVYHHVALGLGRSRYGLKDAVSGVEASSLGISFDEQIAVGHNADHRAARDRAELRPVWACALSFGRKHCGAII